jgi:hypothetical protein
MATEAVAYFHEVPAANWLVYSVNGQGVREWFVRVEIGGLYPRRLGPFSSQQKAVKHYDETQRRFLNLLVGDDSVGWCVEDTLGQAYLPKRKES